MRVSDIQKTWRHTGPGIWHQPRQEMKWTSRARKVKKFYSVWAIYYENTCLRCGERFVSPLKKTRHCSQKCQLKTMKRFGVDHPRWKGGRAEIASGYVLIKIGYKKYIFEHRLIMEKTLGRKLRPSEIVHHINGIKGDNRRENLIVLTRAQHILEHRPGDENKSKKHKPAQ